MQKNRERNCELCAFKIADNTDIKKRARLLYKGYFGERYNEDLVQPEENGELVYNPTLPPEGTEGVPTLLDPEGPDTGTFDCSPRQISKTDIELRADMMQSTFDPEKDRETEIELDKGKCTVGEICDTVKGFIENEFPDYEGIQPAPTMVRCFDDTHGGKVRKLVLVLCGMVKGGVRCLEIFTHYNSITINGKWTENTYYPPYYMQFILDGKSEQAAYGTKQNMTIPLAHQILICIGF